MCYYLTIGSDISSEKLATCVGEAFCIEEVKRQFFIEHMPKATTLANLTDGHCSCSICCEGDSFEEAENRIRRKYQKKGFSESRIKKILAEKKKTYKNDSSTSLITIDILTKILSEGTLLYVYCHMYSGRKDDEKLPATAIKSFSIDCLKVPLRSWLLDDTIIYFRKQFDY